MPHPSLQKVLILLTLLIASCLGLWVGSHRTLSSSPTTLSPQEIVDRIEQGDFSPIEATFRLLRQLPFTIDGPKPELEVTYSGVSAIVNDFPLERRSTFLLRLDEWDGPKPLTPTAALLKAYIHLARGEALQGGKPVSELTEKETSAVAIEVTAAEQAIQPIAALAAEDISYRIVEVRVATGRGKNVGSWYRWRGSKAGAPPDFAYRPLVLWLVRNVRETCENRFDWSPFILEQKDRWPGVPGEILYARMIRMLGANQVSGLAWDRELDHEVLKRGLIEILRRDPAEIDALNFSAFCAWVTGDAEWMAETYPRIEGQWRPSVWGKESYFREAGDALNDVLVPSPSFAQSLLKAEKYARLEEIYRSVLPYRATESTKAAKLDCFYRALCAGTGSHSPDSSNQSLERSLLKWKSAFPESAAPLVMLGKLEIGYAWKARGDGYADTVTNEGWKGFSLHLERAATNLSRAIELGHDPEAYALTVTVAMGQGWSTPKALALVREGAKAGPDYLPLYSRTLELLEPKWGGSEEEQAAFITDMSNRRGGEKGDELYARMCIMHVGQIGSTNFFKRSGLDPKRLQRGFASLREKFPLERHWLHMQAVFACRAHDQATAKRLLEEIGDEYSEVWLRPEYFQEWKTWAQGKGPPPDQALSSK